MKNPQSSVMYSVIAPGARSPGSLSRARSPGGSTDVEESCVAAASESDASGGGLGGILAPAPDRVIVRPLRLQHCLQRAKDALGLVCVVGRVIADVDVNSVEARFGPSVDREMRLGQQHRS